MLGQVALALTVPTAVLHVAAFVDPDATTGTVHTWSTLRAAIGHVFDPAAWSAALRMRALPLAVGATVGGIVALPLAAAALGIAMRWMRAHTEARVRAVAIALVAGAVVVHAWLALLVVRSDTALRDDPQRMFEARARMQAVHRATVERIEAHHALLRARLGPGAVP
jgi:hypothetical protein